MKNNPLFKLSVCLVFLLFSSTVTADGFIKKEVYSFKDKNGNLVFTDKKPSMNAKYSTKTIEAANSTGSTATAPQTVYFHDNANNKSRSQTAPIVRVKSKKRSSRKTKSYKKLNNQNRCHYFKRKHVYYSDKLKAGYKNSEYKKLESNRKKFRNLLFNHCETKTFLN